MEEQWKQWEKWFLSCTNEERGLCARAIDLEETYFSDMTLKDYSKLGEYQTKKGDAWVPVISSLDESGILDISYGWRFTIVRDSEWSGRCTPGEKLIEIDEAYKDDDVVLLHEMIHAYESLLTTEGLEVYKQYLIIDLYERLLPRIPDLRDLLLADANIISAEGTGFVHGPLFLLKSADLDLRHEWPLGTTHGYGRQDVFEQVRASRSQT